MTSRMLPYRDRSALSSVKEAFFISSIFPVPFSLSFSHSHLLTLKATGHNLATQTTSP